MADTRKLWEMFQKGVYDVCLSSVTLKEVSDCPEPKRSVLRDYLKQIRLHDILELKIYCKCENNPGCKSGCIFKWL